MSDGYLKHLRNAIQADTKPLSEISYAQSKGYLIVIKVKQCNPDERKLERCRHDLCTVTVPLTNLLPSGMLIMQEELILNLTPRIASL